MGEPFVPDGWELRDDGLPYPVGVELIDGEAANVAGFYALRQALEAGGCTDPDTDASNGLAALRSLGFDIEWVAGPGYTPRPSIDDDPELAAGLDNRELRNHRLKALFFLWGNYREADSPVRAAHAMSVFDNAMFHYRTELEVEGILEPEDEAD